MEDSADLHQTARVLLGRISSESASIHTTAEQQGSSLQGNSASDLGLPPHCDQITFTTLQRLTLWECPSEWRYLYGQLFGSRLTRTGRRRDSLRWKTSRRDCIPICRARLCCRIQLPAASVGFRPAVSATTAPTWTQPVNSGCKTGRTRRCCLSSPYRVDAAVSAKRLKP